MQARITSVVVAFFLLAGVWANGGADICKSLRCADGQECAKSLLGDYECYYRPSCDDGIFCPPLQECDIMRPCPSCQFQQVCKMSCNAIKCDAQEQCVLQDGFPHCLFTGHIKSCEEFSCPDGYRCVESEEHCSDIECVVQVVCVEEAHPCNQYECQQGYTCTEKSICQPLSNDCFLKPVCFKNSQPCDKYHCTDNTTSCIESTHHCVNQVECQAYPACVSVVNPCDDISCPLGYTCQQSTNHCDRRSEFCQIRLECVPVDDPCQEYECQQGYECYEDRSHCNPDALETCHAWAACLKNDVCEEYECEAGTFCQPTKTRCAENICPEIPTCVESNRIGKTLKLSEDSIFENVVHKGVEGFFLKKELLVSLLKLDPLKEIIEKKTKKKLDVEEMISMILSPPPPPPKPTQHIVKPMRPHHGSSIFFAKPFKHPSKFFKPLKKFKKPASQSLYHSYSRPGMSIFVRDPYKKPTKKKDYSYLHGRTAYEKEEETNEILLHTATETGMPYPAGLPALQTMDRFNFTVDCRDNGFSLNIVFDMPFHGNVSYLHNDLLCSQYELHDKMSVDINVPYTENCFGTYGDFKLSHFLLVEWKDGAQEVIPVACVVETRRMLDAQVSINPSKTTSIEDVKSSAKAYLLIFDKFGERFTGSVGLRETIQLYFTIGMSREHEFDSDLMNCWAETENGEGFPVIRDACSLLPEYIKGPKKTYQPNRKNKWNTYDIVYTIKAFPVNGSLDVNFRCESRLCMPKCLTEINCGDVSVKKMERQRRHKEDTTIEIQTSYHITN